MESNQRHRSPLDFSLQLVVHIFSRDVYTRNTPPHLVQPPEVYPGWHPALEPPVHQGLAPCYNMC